MVMERTKIGKVEDRMIEKKIHYCWFGGKKLPKSAKKCIASWEKFFPDYEIIQWNEDNYDINKIPYTKIAYEAKKYAYISDYARMDILYNYGGIYFDTDVEVIKSFGDILALGSFMGCEIDGQINNSNEVISKIAVAPGLGIASTAGLVIYKEVMNFYEKFTSQDSKKIINKGYIVPETTKVLMNHGLENRLGIQTVEGINIFPKEYFNPLDSATGRLIKTNNTHSIHWYTASWLPKHKQVRTKITQVFHRLFGIDCFSWLKK